MLLRLENLNLLRRRYRGTWVNLDIAVPCALVHAAAAAAFAGFVGAEEEGAEDEADGHPGELHVNILVALGVGLAVELVVDGGHGEGLALAGSELTGKVAAEGLGLLVERDVSRTHGALEMLLVPGGSACDLCAGDGDEDGATDVADEVDEAGDLVGLLLGHADVGGGGDGDVAEGQRDHLKYAEP